MTSPTFTVNKWVKKAGDSESHSGAQRFPRHHPRSFPCLQHGLVGRENGKALQAPLRSHSNVHSPALVLSPRGEDAEPGVRKSDALLLTGCVCVGGMGIVAQSCLTLFDPVDCSPPGSTVHRTGVGCHALPPGDLPDLGIKPWTPALQADSLPSEPPGKCSAIN